MENIYEVALSIALNLAEKEQKIFVDQLQESWFENSYHKNLYFAYNKLLSQNKELSVINLVSWFRENNYLEKDTIIKITKLFSITDYNEILTKKNIINECWYRFSIRQSALMLQNVSKEVTSENPRSTYILQEIDKLREILTEKTTIKELTNIDSIEQVIHKHNQAKLGIPLGLELGWKCLNQKLILEPDDVMVVGGRPAMGKTAFAISLIRNICFDENKVCVFFSLEMAHDRIIRRIISNITGINSNSIKYGKCTPRELAEIEALKEHPKWHNIIIFDGSHTTKDIEMKLQQVLNTKTVDVVMIDYLQKIMPTKAETRYHEVTKISNDVKRMVMAHKIPCIALAQLSRDAGKTGKRPTLPDLKESGEIEQDASIVAFLHRPEYYGELSNDKGESTKDKGEFKVAKNRDGEIGIYDMQVNLITSEWNDLPETVVPKSQNYDTFTNPNLPF